MSFSFKVKSPGKLIRALTKRNSKFRQFVRRNYILGADRFITDIRAKYYSGQRGDIGVNRISGNLHKRWLPEVKEEGLDIIATISNEMNYAVIHEFGTTIHDKRTFVTEEIQGPLGQQHFTRAVNRALKAAY